MGDLKLLIDLHKDAARQGPGGCEQTCLAIEMSGLKGQPDLKIADIGCGTGASTVILARQLDAHITAVDLLPEFLKILDDSVKRAGIEDRITTLAHPMEELPFPEAELDAIWAEGAIYSMGFEAGVNAWRSFLKPGGILAVSEITWLTHARPDELQAYWDNEYPEIDTASAKIAVLERQGFSPVGYFPLPERCWIENYYQPMRHRFEDFLNVHRHSDAAKAIVEAEETEIALYER